MKVNIYINLQKNSEVYAMHVHSTQGQNKAGCTGPNQWEKTCGHGRVNEPEKAHTTKQTKNHQRKPAFVRAAASTQPRLRRFV